MSDINLPPMPDRSLIILKKLQSKLPEYKPYKENVDIKGNSLTIYNEITKRVKIISSNLSAAIQNLKDYNLLKEASQAEETLKKLQYLASLPSEFTKTDKVINATQEEIKKLYEMDEFSVDTLLSIQDNVNTFRGASISGEFDKNVLDKINKGINDLMQSWDNRKKFFETKA